jgi:hypothetical protein
LFYNVLHMFYTCFVQEKCFWSWLIFAVRPSPFRIVC